MSKAISGEATIKHKSGNFVRRINNTFEEIIHNFKSKDIMRISIATGSSGILDKYINNRQKEIVSKYISGKMPGYVLDAGMGAGRWTDFFCNRSREEIGVDVSCEMINVAKNNVKNENASFIICSNTYLPFKDNTFDLSFCCFSLLYLIPMIDFNKATEELVRVTKMSGSIIVIDITSRKPALSDLMLRRTSLQYITAFSMHGATLEHIHGYYIDSVSYTHLTLPTIYSV